MMLAQDYDGKVQVVDNQRISVTMKLSVLDAMKMQKTVFQQQRSNGYWRSRSLIPAFILW